MSRIEDLGWRQGSILPSELLERLAATHGFGIGEHDFGITVSQDCDLVQQSLELEPTFEVLVARAQSGDLQGPKTHGKNPRVLQFQCRDRVYEISMRERYFADRRLLQECGPEVAFVLPERTRKLIPRWMALRYARTAFPTAFNVRIASSVDRIKKILDKRGIDITAIFMVMAMDELPESTPYEISIVATISAEAGNEVRKRALQALGDVCTVLRGCAGITMGDHEVLSEAEMTVEELGLFHRWDFDFLSDKHEPAGPIAPR